MPGEFDAKKERNVKKAFLKGLLAVFMLVCLLSSACAEGSYKRIKGNYYYLLAE